MLFPSPGVVEISQRDQPFASRRLSHKRGDEARLHPPASASSGQRLLPHLRAAHRRLPRMLG